MRIFAFASLLLILWATLLSSGPSFAEDADEEVIYPSTAKIHTEKDPGVWDTDGMKAFMPEIKFKIRKSGLETIRLMEFRFSETVLSKDSKDIPVKAIYLRDKDLLILGYKDLSKTIPKKPFTFSFNGIINSVELTIESKEHGVWKENIRVY